MALAKGATVVDISREKVTQKEFTSRMAKVKPQLVVLNGHGSETELAGQDNGPLLDLTNAHALKGTVTYARSCNSAHTLGPATVVQGAKAYIGYLQPFYMGYNRDKVIHPLEDEVAALFLEPSNHVVTSLLKGHPAGDASARSKTLSMKTIQRLTSSDALPEDHLYAKLMWFNMINQICHGDPSATV